MNVAMLSDNLTKDDRLCVLGDFNLSDVGWSNLPNSNEFLPSNVNKPFEITVIDTFLSLGLTQINTVLNKLNKVLDLIFINQDLNFSLSESSFPFTAATAHHTALEIRIKAYKFAVGVNNNMVRYNYFKANFDDLNYFIYSLNWENLLDNEIIAVCYESFLTHFLRLMEENIPLAKPPVYKLPWYTSGLKKLKNLRNKYDKLYKLSNNAIDYANFKHYQREFNLLNKCLYNQYMMSFNGSIKQNPRRFFTFINSKRNCSSIPIIMKYKDLISSNLTDSLNLFSSYFQSNFNDDLSPFDHIDLNGINSSVDFSLMLISEEDVVNGITKLSNSPKSDNDGISALVLKKCTRSIVHPLKIIFNKSLSAGYFIQRWKFTTILPIHKSGNKNDVCNYRPISKLTNVAKIFEHIIYDKIFFSLKRHISISQHGFMVGRSTTTNLAVFTNFCISSFEKGFQVDCIYTDFAKAFDRVPHNLLLAKLAKIGFRPPMLSWFRHYLTGRCSVVSVDDLKSNSFVPLSGIPQGSILGPLLFNIFINDISTIVKSSQCLLYADDLKIFKQISSVRDIMDLQNDLDRIVSWSDLNGLPLNVSKCFSMSFHRLRNSLPSLYKIKGLGLPSVDEIVDLGVVFDTKLSFNNHLNIMLPKAYSMFAFIRRNSDKCFDHYTKKTLFISFVRSKLEYASFIWGPNAKVHINRVERIQKKFIKYTLSFLNFPTDSLSNFIPSYADKCSLIGMKTLEARRDILSLNFLYGIIWGLVDCQDLLQAIQINVPSRSLRFNSYFFNVGFHRTEYALNEPLTKVLRLYNKHCNQLDISFSHQHFKTILNNLIN